MSITLQTYITGFQRLVHDSTYKFHTQAELTDYANAARRKVAAETGCNRTIVKNFPLATGNTTINYASIITAPVAKRVIGLLDIYLWYSPAALRIPLKYFPYGIFSRSAIVAYNYTGPPEIWTQVGSSTAYVARIPDVDYTLDLDASVEPVDLANLTDAETEIASPFTECVKFYMAHLAKLKNQDREAANSFLMDYVRERNSVGSSSMIRKLVGQ